MTQTGSPVSGRRPIWSGARRFVFCAVTLALCVAHSLAIYFSCGGSEQLASDWPLAIHDHPLHFHSSTLAPRFFAQTRTNAGYDPSFMAGYPKSVIFPESSAMYDTVAIATGGTAPPQAHKLTVLAATSALPWLLALACVLLGLPAGATMLALVCFLVYVWSDGGGAGFPLNYAMYGMVSYLLVVPLGLAGLAAWARFLERGGIVSWLVAATLAAAVLLVHVTSLIIVAPAAIVAYLVALLAGRLALRRQMAAVAAVVLAVVVNAFWWWPGLGLRSMRTESSPAFIHREGPWVRLWQVVFTEPPAQVVLLCLGMAGFCWLWSRWKEWTWTNRRLGLVALTVYAAIGFFWGYLAALFPEFDFLQPGRHTYVLYTSLCVGAGVVASAFLSKLKERSALAALFGALALLLVGVRLFGPDIWIYGNTRVRSAPFLSSRPSQRLQWVVDQIKQHVKPGDRLLYEECGADIDGVPDPYQGGRYSGLLPYLTGIEVIGGPYLRAGIKTNFTQFGEGRLFGREEWTRGFFERYASYYRPSAIICWSPVAVAFCEAHPELVEILARNDRPLPAVDPRTGRRIAVNSRVIFGRIRGFEGKFVHGRGTVRAEPGRLIIEDAVADELDGLVVLGYHNVPRLRATPPVRFGSVKLGDDPVGLIGFRPPSGRFVLEMDFRP